MFFRLTYHQKYGFCAIHAQLNENANVPDCQFTYLELAIAADRGRRACEKPFEKCPQYPLYDKDDDCNGIITFTRDQGVECWP